MFVLLQVLALSKPLPIWPKKYRLKGSWSIPYAQIREPFIVYTDYMTGRQAEIAYNGLQTTLHFISDKIYQLQPNKDHTSCLYSDLEGAPGDKLHEYLPEGADWTYIGQQVVVGRMTDVWEKITHKKNGWYYRFYVDSESQIPIRYFQHGRSSRGSHPADYIFDIEDFGPTIDENVFVLPTNCSDVTSGGPTRQHVAEDISARKTSGTNSDYCPVKEVKFDGNLPKEFSWRDHPGVLPAPRDQANCGSCWAQAAIQAVSAAFSLKKGHLTNVSVQQMVDCAWSDKNYACKGGESDEALYTYIRDQRPVALDSEYPYIGVGGYCGKEIDNPVGYIKSCFQVVPKDNEQLSKALYVHGPVIVAILASLDTFVEYNGGVYKDAQCSSEAELDHCVLLTGWKYIDGVLCWEIMNSWSDMWGVQGYGYIHANDFNFDCGITTQAFVPEVVTGKL